MTATVLTGHVPVAGQRSPEPLGGGHGSAFQSSRRACDGADQWSQRPPLWMPPCRTEAMLLQAASSVSHRPPRWGNPARPTQQPVRCGLTGSHSVRASCSLAGTDVGPAPWPEAACLLLLPPFCTDVPRALASASWKIQSDTPAIV